MMSKKVPELRFKGFTDDWEQRKLGSLTTVVRGSSPRPIQDPKWFDKESDIGWLRIADVTEQNGRIYHLEQHISKLGQEKTRVLTEPHLLLSIAATVGKPVINYVKTGVHDGFLIFLNPTFEREFMFQWLEMFRPKWQKYGQPGSQVNLNSELVRNQEIVLPNYKEQQKIGTFFKQLDDIIALYQRKLDLLKEQKKGFLQKMFPKNGAKVPELRFAGFADDWEERKLGEVATFLNGRAYKQDELLDSGKYKVLRVGNFYTNDSWYYSNMELDDKYYIDKGDLVYTWSATFGPHIWSGEKVIYHYHIWKVELSKFLDRNFTLQLLEADKERLLSSTNGSTMIHVTKGDMESKIVSIPNIDEQKQIGSFFKQLDDTIALHQRKLDLLKEQKKGFLQKMFV
ncbi:restriction endonuclease subunit S [Streptococcus thermophilus]|nr:restriction endonuclease subunit S [Streptococcus thermophilus]